jgi:Family of unknown function (DUF6461)
LPRDRFTAAVGRYAQSSFCVLFVRDIDEAELLSRFGSRVRSVEGEVSRSEFAGSREPVVAVGRARGWAFALESRSREGISTPVLSAVSAGTTAVAMYRALDAFTEFAFAEDGALMTRLNSLALHQREGSDPDRLLPWLLRLGLTPETAFERTADPDAVVTDGEAMTALVKDAFAVPLTPRIFEGPFPLGAVLATGQT